MMMSVSIRMHRVKLTAVTRNAERKVRQCRATSAKARILKLKVKVTRNEKPNPVRV